MEVVQIGNATLYCGDCLDVLKTLPDASIEAIVTDPPAGIGFMGKDWDHHKGGRQQWVAWMTDIAAECLRVLKPGGHALVWAIPRTSHWTATAWEDAGFEIRDRIAHCFGGGFPKSLDVSKAIDRMDASEEQERRRLRFTAWVRSTGVTARQIDEATRTCMGNHYTTHLTQPAIMTREHLEACRHLLGDVPEWVEREADIRSVESRNMAEREVVGTRITGIGTGNGATPIMKDGNRSITAPATPAAKQWAGWGTALKPAIEDWWLCRKPLDGTVAGNVLKHGCGALNVDGCRVATPDGMPAWNYPNGPGGNVGQAIFSGLNSIKTEYNAPEGGRFPANLIHDGSDEVVGLFPVNENTPKPRSGGFREAGASKGLLDFKQGSKATLPVVRGDSGSAARFFKCCPMDDPEAEVARLAYVPKASKADRDEGCEGLEERARKNCTTGNNGEGDRRTIGRPSSIEKEPLAKARNHHPTVKSTALMTYLCRLITPPGGTVLDPFMGSGSTGKAAMLEGFRFIGIEREAEYLAIAQARISAAQRQPDLFNQEAA